MTVKVLISTLIVLIFLTFAFAKMYPPSGEGSSHSAARPAIPPFDILPTGTFGIGIYDQPERAGGIFYADPANQNSMEIWSIRGDRSSILYISDSVDESHYDSLLFCNMVALPEVDSGMKTALYLRDAISDLSDKNLSQKMMTWIKSFGVPCILDSTLNDGLLFVEVMPQSK
ncbi:MAG: hypothetical protein ACI83D_000260 [Planctomycetota bacterium]|jgi:hypothetical protein